MQTGMIFTSFVSFLVSLSAMLAGLSIFVSFKKGKRIDRAMGSYSMFLIITGLAWFFIASDFFAAWLGKENLSYMFFLTNQMFVFCTGVPLSFYLVFKTWKSEKLSKLIATFYVLGTFLGVFLTFYFGGIEGGSTYFASKIKPNNYALLVFVIFVTPLFFLAMVDMVRRFTGWIKKRDSVCLYDFFYSLIVFIYLFLGFFDERGLIVGWPLVFFRLLFVAVFFLAYTVFSFQILKGKEFVLYNEE